MVEQGVDGTRLSRDPRKLALPISLHLYWFAPIRAHPWLIFIDFVGGLQLPDDGNCGFILQPLPNHQNR